jgi:hypothetical protein
MQRSSGRRSAALPRLAPESSPRTIVWTRSLRVLRLLAAALTAGACADSPSQPVPTPVTARFAAGETPVGQFVIPNPVNSNQSSLKWTSSGIVAPTTGKYRVRVEGALTVEVNPDLATLCPGFQPDLSYVGDYGPAGNALSGQTKRMGGINLADRALLSIYSRGFTLQSPTPTTLEAEATLSAGSAVWVARETLATTVICRGRGPYAIYVFRGTQVLTVLALGSPARLIVECNSVQGSVSLPRGATLSCQARTEPEGGNVTDARWTFQDTRNDGPAIPGPAGENTWSGPMAVGGTITLAAKVNGEEQTASSAVTVSKRAWRDALPERRTVHCPAAGVADCPLNVPLVHDKDVGQTRIRWRIQPRGLRINTGPNAGWRYMGGTQGALEFFDYVTYLNSELLNPRSRLFRGGCTQSGVTSWINRHENVHVGKISSYVDRNRLNPLVEEVVAYGEDGFKQARERNFARIQQMTSNLGDPGHRDNDYPPDPCDLGLAPNPGT